MLDLDSLNPRQREAVTHTEGPLLVLAGAGSGKTRVIICRTAYLVTRRHIAPEAILAVTFTNKAAAEMKERAQELLGRQRSALLTVATFHSLCVRILKEEIVHLGYRRNFSIYSGSDQAGVMRQVMREAGVDTRRYDPETILWKVSAAKNALIPPECFVGGTGDIDRLTADLYPRYQKALKVCNAVDFDDLIMLTVNIFRTRTDILEKWQRRFRYVMVDEYQDTNGAQYALVKMLAAGSRNLCVVGDDDQSIYGWRGADVGNILSFEQDWPECRVVKLEQNYRSTGAILTAANSVIANNPVRKEKKLWTAAGDGEPIDLLVASDDEEEATSVVERIQAEVFRGELSYSDFAILYRTNAQSRAFEEQLRYESVPYILVGGYRFFDRKEVKDTISYLKVIANPADEQALSRIINFPRRGIGEGAVTRINSWSLEKGCTLFEALGRIEEVPGVPDATKLKIVHFHRSILHAQKRLIRANLAEGVRELFRGLGIEDELYRTSEDGATAKRRVENVEQVVNSVAAFEERSGGTLEEFLERISLLDEERVPGKDKKEREDAVTLMSLHSSKGLEFPHVFLVGMEEEILPHRRSLEEGYTVDEERRLCYVGITRARRKLVLTRCAARKRYGKSEERQPSRFLAEIPETLLREISPETPVATEEEADQMAKDFFSRMRAMVG